MITVNQFEKPCNCRSVEECNHNLTVEIQALDAMVDQFAAAMKKKLKEKYLRESYTGWDDPAAEYQTAEQLVSHAIRNFPENGKDQSVDVGNLAAMLYNFRQP